MKKERIIMKRIKEKVDLLKEKTLVVCAEENGLWGQIFFIGAILYDADGHGLDRFVGRCPIGGVIDQCCKEAVLPSMSCLPETHSSYMGMLQAFFDWRAKYRPIKHYTKTGNPVEVVHTSGRSSEMRLYVDAHRLGFIEDWDSPFPMIDITTIPEMWCAVDEFLEVNGVDTFGDSVARRNPLIDLDITYTAYRFWLEHSSEDCN